MRGLWLAAGLLLAELPGMAVAGPEAEAGTRRALILCGLPGDDAHRKAYAKSVEEIAKALTERCGFPASEVWVRFGTATTPGDGPILAASRGLSDRSGIEADVAALRQRTKPEDTLWVIAIGHGHLDGRRSWFNVPGRDIDDRGFGKLFEGINAKEQVFFITMSASGFFLKPLSTPGRVVITATEADQEVNETLFHHALAEVLATAPAGTDRDKNGEISLLELYLATVANVMQRYLDDENLPTEHAQLDDNGDGRGSEVQEAYLPEELGGRPIKKKEIAKPKDAEKEKAKDQEKDKKEEAEETRPDPVLTPKDEGFRASKIRVDVSKAPEKKPEP